MRVKYCQLGLLSLSPPQAVSESLPLEGACAAWVSSTVPYVLAAAAVAPVVSAVVASVPAPDNNSPP